MAQPTIVADNILSFSDHIWFDSSCEAENSLDMSSFYGAKNGEKICSYVYIIVRVDLKVYILSSSSSCAIL